MTSARLCVVTVNTGQTGQSQVMQWLIVKLFTFNLHYVFTWKTQGAFMCVCYRSPGQWGHTHDDAGLQHGEGPLTQVAEESEPAAAGRRPHRVVWINEELPQSQSPADVWVCALRIRIWTPWRKVSLCIHGLESKRPKMRQMFVSGGQGLSKGTQQLNPGS